MILDFDDLSDEELRVRLERRMQWVLGPEAVLAAYRLTNHRDSCEPCRKAITKLLVR